MAISLFTQWNKIYRQKLRGHILTAIENLLLSFHEEMQVEHFFKNSELNHSD